MEDRKNFIITVLYYGLILGLVYVFCNYALGILAPFIIGFLFAYVSVKLARKIFKKDTKISRIVALLIVYLIIVGVITLLVILGINELTDFLKTIPYIYKDLVEPVFDNMRNDIYSSKVNLPFAFQDTLNDAMNNLFDSIKDFVSSASSYLVTGATSIVSNTTSLLISILTLIITSFFVVVDYENIINYLESLMNEKTKEIYDELTDFLLNTVWLVIKSYGFIMLVTFVELLIGLLILGVSSFALVSMVIAVLDILPVLGVGTILIPWGIIELIVGDTYLGVGLLVLYLIITVIRNILEPKIVGGNLDLHPLATLFAMLIGLDLFGVLGLFGLPLTMSFLVKRNIKIKEQGVK